jgi:hypothetical protein
VASAADEWFPRPSPDGRFVLFTSEESGRSEVYATTFPEPKSRWQVSVDGGHWPRWRADGREIFYAAGDSILAVTVEPDPNGLVLGKPRLLFQRPPSGWTLPWPDGFGVTADGQRFLITRSWRRDRDTTEQPGIAIVRNWYAEFEPGS